MTVYPHLDNILFQKSQVLFQFLKSFENLFSNLFLLLCLNLYVMLEINISLTVHWQEMNMCVIDFPVPTRPVLPSYMERQSL